MKAATKEKQRRKIRFGGLFRKIFLTAILCMLVPLLITAITTIRSVQTNLEETANQNLQQLSVEKMNEVDSVIQNQIALTKVVAESPYVAEIVAEQKKSGELDAAANEKLTDYLVGIYDQAEGLYENFFITCGTEGIADGLGGTTLHDVTGEPWYDACVAQGEFLGNNISPVTGRPVYVISYAIKDPATGDVVGGLNNSIDLANMTNAITGSITDKAQKVLIIDTDGNIIASQNEEQILQVNFNETNNSTAELMTQMLANGSGHVEFEFDGERNVGAYANTGSMFTMVYMPVSEYTSMVSNLVAEIVLVVIICFILATGFIGLISLSITKPLRNMVGIVGLYGNADFSQTIPAALRKRRDEIGVLAKSMDNMQNSLRDAFRDIIQETDFVNDSINVSNDRIITLSSKIENVNDITTDLAAEMQETAASTEMMNQNACNIKAAIDVMNRDAQNGKEFSEGISERAQSLKQNAVQSQKRASELTNEISEGLKVAIEQSRAVNQIDELSGAILEIASQTNLLALNASIEAARAGEFGKGFAVVAEEIRKLAENSEDTVNAIQDVTRQVVVAVNNLSENSQKTVEFIDKTVIGDYQTMVDIGERYYEDADSVKDLVEAISSSVDNLQEAINAMTESINEITRANSEEASSITNITHNTSDVMESAEHVTELMASVESSTHKLKDAIGRFSI